MTLQYSLQPVAGREKQLHRAGHRINRSEETGGAMRLPQMMFILVLGAMTLGGCARERHITTGSDQAREAYVRGVDLWQKFYYSEAASAFDEALHLDSSFALAWTRRAQLNTATRNRERSLADISRALALLPYVTPFEQRFIRLQDYALRNADREAVGLADSMIALYPDDAELYLIRGTLHESGKDMDDAIRCYRQATEVDTGFALAVMSLGYAYSTVGNQDRAIEQMERYIRLAPDAADPRASFADILMRVGRYDEAFDQYTQSLALKPDYWYSMNQIGTIYMVKGRLKEAEDQFHKGLAHLPESRQLSATHLALDANLNILRGAYENALEQNEQALEMDPENLDAASGKVNALRKLRALPQAREALGNFRRELEKENLHHSRSMLSYYLLSSRLSLDEGDAVSALAACDSALEYATALTRGPIFRQIAEIRSKLSEFEEALDACEEALQINPNNPDALLTLVRVYTAQGDRSMARAIGTRLLEFWKDADPDYEPLREVRTLLGMKQRSNPG
jgi:tetratricopeptide (TPR) repeat protein